MAFLSWDVRPQWLEEVQGDLNAVDNEWIDGEKGGRPDPSNDHRQCSSEAWLSVLEQVRTKFWNHVGGQNGTALATIRALDERMAQSRNGSFE
ncbi:hypothetical protein Forpe1208_v009602 [Fusarium oxysporum f. sp. rapae]|uniref:Uncharacterized protein n=1 Tax=Fusarium oxysporum f. sp. rapae TaxID=485398 RepID=A0A8J5U7Y9_FUSOX|nr:hypothetical protein Forpe1208_v009602 [Fusarium oxysporum f. sp. rapae]